MIRGDDFLPEYECNDMTNIYVNIFRQPLLPIF